MKNSKEQIKNEIKKLQDEKAHCVKMLKNYKAFGMTKMANDYSQIIDKIDCQILNLK